MTWLSSDPAPLPPEPADVDVTAEVEAALGDKRSPALQYFAAHAPRIPLDTWGQPLPLARSEQEDANRLWALLVSPLHRGRALMRSGAILPSEAALLHDVYPDLWLLLDQELQEAMVRGKPPFPAWAESLIATWYAMPAAAAYSQAQEGQKGGASPSRGGRKSNDTALPTPADRRELAVRER